jgi:rRNA maturation RNase YbeY
LKINIFYDEIKYRLTGISNVKRLIEKVIRSENKIPGDLSFIITSDTNLIEINREFLEHDYFTDVIAFSDSNNNIVNGEIYISIDTVKRNSINYKVSLREELIRVMIHGTLHLCGYEDDTVKKKAIMNEKEETWLENLKNEEDGVQI